VFVTIAVLLAAPCGAQAPKVHHVIAGLATDEECEPGGQRVGEQYFGGIINMPIARHGFERPPQANDFQPAGPDDGPQGPSGSGNGSVSLEGEFTFAAPLPEPAPIAGKPFNLAFVYRSEGCESAMPGFHMDWHFNAIDKVTINLGPGGEADPQILNWLTGEGNKYDYPSPAQVQGPNGTEFWWNVWGSPFSRFRYYEVGTVRYLERYTARGSVTRYQKRAETATQTIWRPIHYWDSHDNKTTLTWRVDGKLESILDPRGILITFAWTTNACAVSYSKLSTPFPELDWSFSFDGSERITEIRRPASSYVKVQGGSPLFDLSNPTLDQRGLTFTYDGVSTNVETVRDFRGTPTPYTVLLTNTYERVPSGTGPWRLTHQVDVHGQPHVIAYTLNGTTLTKILYTSPRLTQHEYAVDNFRRPTSVKVTPNAQHEGKPRASDGDEAEPASLMWQFEYAPGCPCELPIRVIFPSLMEHTYTWDLEIGKLTSMTVPRPSADLGTVMYQWTYTDFEHFGQPLSYTPPAGGASVTFDYTNPTGWSTRADGLWGYKYRSFTVSTSPITLVNSNQQTISTVVEVLSDGRADKVTTPGGAPGQSVTHEYEYDSDRHLDYIQRAGSAPRKVDYEFDILGRLKSLATGEPGGLLTVSFLHDAFGRITQSSVVPAAGQTAYVTELYRDRYENVAVTRRKNLGPDGQPPKYADGSGGGRAWVRNERHYFYDRQHTTFVDRRPLPDGDDLTNPTTGPNPWMVRYDFVYHPDGTLDRVTLPNGRAIDYQIDGYEKLYKAVVDDGGLNVESPRFFFDNDLIIAKIKRKLEGPLPATTTFTRNANGYLYKMTEPTSVAHTLLFDDLGRTVQRDVANGAGTVRLRSTYVWDEIGRLKIAHRDALIPGVQAKTETKFLYNELSQILEIESDLDRKVFRTYDQAGRLKTVRDNLDANPANTNEVELFYQSGRDLVEQLTAKVFEDLDTPVRKSYVRTYERDLLGRVTKVHNKGLDGAATPITSHYGYDSFGHVAAFTDPLGYDTVGAFDAVGRWVEIVKRGATQPPQSSGTIRMTSEYRDEIAQTEVIRRDGSNFETKQIFDAAYRLLELRRPGYSGGVAHSQAYTYDPGSRVKTIRDGNGSVVTQFFGQPNGVLLGRLVTLGSGVSGLATSEVFEYDDIFRLKKATTNQTGGTLMGSVEFDRDGLGRLLKEEFRYFGIDPSQSTVIASGYSTGSGDVGDPGFRRSLTYSNQLQLGFEPDAIARAEEFKILAGPAGIATGMLATYRFSGSRVNRRTTRYLGTTNSQITELGFDSYQRIVSIDDKIVDGMGAESPFSRFEFEWDAAGNLLKEKYTTVSGRLGDRFHYDPFHRLDAAKLGVDDMDVDFASVQGSVKEIIYALDPGNSRSSVTEKPDGQPPTTTSYQVESNSPRYAQVGSAALQYDGEGNMTFDGQYYLVYDFKNRLSEVYFGFAAASGGERSALAPSTPIERLREARADVLRKLGGRLDSAIRDPKTAKSEGRLTGQSSSAEGGTVGVDLIATYGYDPFNRRILRMVTTPGFENHRYAYDGWDEVEELAPVFEDSIWKAKTQKAFVWGARLDELVAYHRLEGSVWKPYYAATARHGSVVRLLRGDGAVVEKAEYDAFGRASVYVGISTIPQATSSVGNPYLYAGKRLDHETGFLYLRNRYVHTAYGRFLTNDPLGSWADPYSLGNGYVLAGNAPTVLGDPYGLLSIAPGYGGPADSGSWLTGGSGAPPGYDFSMSGAGSGGGGCGGDSGMSVDDSSLDGPEIQDPSRGSPGVPGAPLIPDALGSFGPGPFDWVTSTGSTDGFFPPPSTTDPSGSYPPPSPDLGGEDPSSPSSSAGEDVPLPIVGLVGAAVGVLGLPVWPYPRSGVSRPPQGSSTFRKLEWCCKNSNSRFWNNRFWRWLGGKLSNPVIPNSWPLGGSGWFNWSGRILSRLGWVVAAVDVSVYIAAQGAQAEQEMRDQGIQWVNRDDNRAISPASGTTGWGWSPGGWGK
jgi:RHS repeat-associated protein